MSVWRGRAQAFFEMKTRAKEAARPWLRRDAWSRGSLRELASQARRRPRQAALAVALGVGLVLALSFAVSSGDPAKGIATAPVQEGPFHVTITEAGTLQALRSLTYASTIQSNQAKIVALAPEGKLVKKDDLLVLFDAAPFEEEIRRNQALLAQAQADLMKARQDVNLQQIQNTEDFATARLKVERSDLELMDVQEGKGRLKEDEAAAAVGNALRDLKKAEGALADLKPLLAEGFITKAELERAEQQVSRAQEDLSLARRRRDALLNYGRPLELAQARSDAVQSKETARQLQAAASYRTAQKRAAIDGADSRIEEARSKLDLAKVQLTRTEVRADVPGIVVYKEVFFGSEQRKPQVGDQVWANQPLLILPDISTMVVETKVRETDIHKVERNQKVKVRVEAYPDLQLTGAVTLVGTLAQEEKDRRGAKFFGVTVEIKEREPRLRPGMTARVELQVESMPKALFVPLEAVFEREGRHFVYVVDRLRIRPQAVTLGPSSQDFAVVLQGLREGERVCLRDPSAAPSDFSGLSAR